MMPRETEAMKEGLDAGHDEDLYGLKDSHRYGTLRQARRLPIFTYIFIGFHNALQIDWCSCDLICHTDTIGNIPRDSGWSWSWSWSWCFELRNVATLGFLVSRPNQIRHAPMEALRAWRWLCRTEQERGKSHHSSADVTH
jgi:hypothetical protein